MTRVAHVLPAVALIALGLAACGGAQSRHAPASSASLPSAPSLMGDQDSDSRGTGYHDADDAEIRAYGHAASTADTRAITTLVQRYYAAAAAQDGARACALTYYLDVETLPEQYGEPSGPRWLAGANTCPVLLSRVFSHFHGSLSAPVVVSAVRVSGGRADALVGFRTLPAGFVKARREGHTWKIDGLLAAPLP